MSCSTYLLEVQFVDFEVCVPYGGNWKNATSRNHIQQDQKSCDLLLQKNTITPDIFSLLAEGTKVLQILYEAFGLNH